MQSTTVQILRYAWIAVFLLWAVTGRWSKPMVASESAWKSRILVNIVGVGWLLLLMGASGRRGLLGTEWIEPDAAIVYGGAILTFVGLAFAIWARIRIGSNWSAYTTVQADHELVRTGPYAIIRHPIYSGFILATLGTALALADVGGLLAVLIVSSAWAYKSRMEEALMRRQFGPAYEQYCREVKALIPGVY